MQRGTDSQDVLRGFITKRQSLNRAIDQSKRDIDAWLERQPLPPPINALANLEVLLQHRRERLGELILLDDQFIGFLSQMKVSGDGHTSHDGGESTRGNGDYPS